MLVGGDAAAPVVADGDGAHGHGVEAGHDGVAHAFHVAGLGIDHALLHTQRLLADAFYAGEHFYGLVEIGGRIEATVHIDYDKAFGLAVEHAAEGGEIIHLGQIHELEIDGVVEMAHGVDVEETQLHGLVVAEFKGGCGYAGVAHNQ